MLWWLWVEKAFALICCSSIKLSVQTALFGRAREWQSVWSKTPAHRAAIQCTTVCQQIGWRIKATNRTESASSQRFGIIADSSIPYNTHQYIYIHTYIRLYVFIYVHVYIHLDNNNYNNNYNYNYNNYNKQRISIARKAVLVCMCKCYWCFFIKSVEFFSNHFPFF